MKLSLLLLNLAAVLLWAVPVLAQVRGYDGSLDHDPLHVDRDLGRRRSRRRSKKRSMRRMRRPPQLPGPSNDFCEDATFLAVGDSVEGTTMDARTDVDLIDDPSSCLGSNHSGVWYSFEGTGDQVYLSTCSSSTFNTSINVLLGNCRTRGFVCAGITSDFCSPGSSAWVDTVAGTLYYVLVSSPGVADFELQILDATPPENDQCEEASPFLPPDMVTGNGLYATANLDAENCQLVDQYAPYGLWYFWIGTAGVTYNATTCGLSNGGLIPSINVYIGLCDSLQCIPLVDQGSCGEQQSWVSFTAGASGDIGSYYIFVHGYLSNVGEYGDFGLDINRVN